MAKSTVFLCCPSYGGIEPETVASMMQASRPDSDVYPLYRLRQPGSLLGHEFCSYWCEALNVRKEAGLTHFAMIHSDVSAQDWWLEDMVKELERTRADVLSAVIPIKDNRGLTSTGIQNKRTGEIDRFTLTQVHAMGKRTFGTQDVKMFPGDRLVVNTGLWVCDFTRPWVEKVHFEVRNGIEKMPDGKFYPTVLPEDWNFSVQCDDLGLRVMATLCVEVCHYGRAKFNNQEIWGHDIDPESSGRWAKEELCLAKK